MKLPTLLVSTFASALLANVSLTNAAPTPPLVAERPVLWSIHFDNHRLSTGDRTQLYRRSQSLFGVVVGIEPFRTR